jgi:hypothetical protein
MKSKDYLEVYEHHYPNELSESPCPAQYALAITYTSPTFTVRLIWHSHVHSGYMITYQWWDHVPRVYISTQGMANELAVGVPGSRIPTSKTDQIIKHCNLIPVEISENPPQTHF